MNIKKNTGDVILDEKSYERLLSQTQDIVFEWDYVTKKIYHTDLFEKKFKHTSNYENFPSFDAIKNIIHPDDLSDFNKTYGVYDEGKLSSVGEFRIRNSENDSYEWYRSSSTAMTDDRGNILKVMGILSNIDVQKKEMLFTQNLAMRDGLTGIYNRIASEQLIKKYIEASTASGAMFIIDIDDFKGLNDNMGHQFGDSVLVSISEALVTLFRKGDVVGRLGGDEFIVFMVGIDEKYNLKRRARDLIAAIKAPFAANSRLVEISGSVGVSVFPKDGVTFDELYKNADIALYRSKRYGKNRYTMFDAKFTLDDSDRNELTNIEKNHDNYSADLGIVGTSDSIIYISDDANMRIMYLNDAAKAAYLLTDDDLGKKCYHAFHQRSHPCVNCLSIGLSFDTFRTSETEISHLNKTFLVREKLIKWKGITARITFATDITKTVQERKVALVQDSERQHLIEAIEKLSGAAILNEGIANTLCSICDFYGGDGAAIMQQPDHESPRINGEIYKISGGGIQTVPFVYEATAGFLEHTQKAVSNHTGALYFDVKDIDFFSKENCTFMETNKISSMLIHATTLLEPNLMAVIINPKENIENARLLERSVHFIETESQKQTLTFKLNAEIYKYRNLINTISDSIFEYDVASDELAINVHDYKKYHMESSMIVYTNAQKTVFPYGVSNISIQDSEFSKLRAAFFGECDEPFEFKILASGKETWLLITPSYTKDALGKLVRVSGVFKNVTDKYLVNENPELKQLKTELEYRKGHDILTGLHNKYRFYETVHTLLEQNPHTLFAIIRFDVSYFKMINDFFGMDEGDRLLNYIAGTIRESAKLYDNIVYARFEADVFYACTPYDSDTLSAYRGKLDSAVARYNLDFEVMLSYGIYLIDDITLPVEIMCDRAGIAQSTIKHSYVKRFAVYDDQLRKKLLSEQELINDMKEGIAKEEFKIFYQPKVDLTSEKAIGAEALVRWVHPKKGMISPGDFIPVFEKNGFIMKLDIYVWQRVCQQLKSWLDAGKTPNPISINVSRANMHNPSLCDIFSKLCQKYNVPTNLLQLEITESFYASGAVNLTEITNKLKAAGFTVLMDDFGSGYSSLNMLKDVPVDVLKVDLNFLSGTETTGRGATIISSIVRMARWLNIPVVAEGVETKSQADFLRSIGCDMAQGYYFARPMPIEEYEKFVDLQSNPSASPALLHSEGAMDIDVLWTPDAQVNLLFNTLVNAIAVVEYSTVLDRIEILRVNDGYYSLMGFNSENKNSAIVENDISWIVEADRDIAWDLISRAIQSRGTATAKLRRYHADRRIMWVEVNLRYLYDDGERFIFYEAIKDITQEKQSIAILQAHKERYQLLSQYSAIRTFEYDIVLNTFSHNLTNATALDSEPIPFTDTYKAQLINSIHPDFRKAAIERFDAACLSTVSDAFTIVMHIDGEYKSYEITYLSIADESGKPIRIIGSVVQANEFGISDHNEALLVLRSIIKSFPGAICRIEVKKDKLRLIYVNDKFCEMYGYTKQAAFAIFENFSIEHGVFGSLERESKIMWEAIKEHRCLVSMDTNVLCKDGSFKQVSSVRGIAYTESGCVVVTIIDTEK